MSITHFLSTLFSAYFLWCFFNRGCTVQMSFPHSRIGMMPSPDVYVFQPKICSSCSPNVATSSSGFQDQVQIIRMCCIMSLDHPQKAVVLVNWQAEHWGVQELPQMVDVRYYQQIRVTCFKLVVWLVAIPKLCLYFSSIVLCHLCDCKNVEYPEESTTSSGPLGFLDQGYATIF